MKEEAIKRAKALSHLKAHGLQSTIDAFEVSRASLFRWKKKLKQNHNFLNSLNNGNRAPKRRRVRVIPVGLKEEIVKWRTFNPIMGKSQIYHLIKNDFNISESTIGRILKDMKLRNQLPLRAFKPYKQRRNITKQRRKDRVGFEGDTIVRCQTYQWR